MATFQLDIVTAERLVSSDQVEVLVAPGIDGELAILPRHAPLLTLLKPGEIRVVMDGEDTFIAVSGGFMEVMPNKVTILADTAERVEEIDLERAEEALRRAQERVAAAPARLPSRAAARRTSHPWGPAVSPADGRQRVKRRPRARPAEPQAWRLAARPAAASWWARRRGQSVCNNRSRPGRVSMRSPK